MDNEEPQLTQIANLQISDAGHKLPEQSRVPECPIPRPFDAPDIIRQWQPMGIRVVVNLPFTGDDQHYLFAIRNGPFIPRLNYDYEDSSVFYAAQDAFPDPKTLSTYCDYAYNNMRNVHVGSTAMSEVNPKEYGVFVTHYDYPPPLSNYSTFFRKWRGTMHYRVRTVAGFTTQGYIFAAMQRNVPGRPSVIDRFSSTNPIPIEDLSFKSSMINSYVMGDTAMFRHFEVQVPFEYPVLYYDQFQWIANRTRPYKMFWRYNSGQNGMRTEVKSALYNEPCGDNYIVFGLRGSLESSVQNSQIAFELEYRAGDDFQFSDPFLPFPEHFQTPRLQPNGSTKDYIGQTSPSTEYTSLGLQHPKANSTDSDLKVTLKPVTITNNNPPGSIRNQTNTRTASLRRNPREVDEDNENGYDTVDNPPLRKSLRQLLTPS